MNVTTSGGQVRGTSQDGVVSFLGVPFARAARFESPVPAAWEGVLDAAAYGPMSPQPSGEVWLRHDLPRDEDCLSLNIWTPGAEGSRPVLVWIHGGGFRQGSGSGPLYDGDRLAREGDVVVVTINYRLGALGFLNHPDLARPDGSSGNWGLLDQIEALRWVRGNIAGFGGDPDNVTIFGESAGGGSTSLLTASPPARGLFHRTVVQSGAPIAISPRRAASQAEKLAAEVGVDGVAALRDVPVDDLIRGQAAIESADGGEMVFLPTVDGSVIDRRPLETYAAGEAAPVPMLIGTNVDEWKLWAPADPHSRDLDEEHLRRRVGRLVNDGADEIIATYRQARAERGEPVEPKDLWFAIKSDQFFRVPALRVADAHAAHQPTFVYLFGWGSPAMGGWMGACHALEIAFVFGTHVDPIIGSWTGTGPAADALSEQMMQAWLAFARTGDPSTDALPWPAHDTTARPTMRFDERSRVEHAPAEPERLVVDAYLGGELV